MPLPEILLIEDRADDRELFAQALLASRLQASLVHASGVTEALGHLTNQRDPGTASRRLPSLIVLDLGLPGIEGKTLLRIIRAAYSPREIPIVVLTGSQRADDRARCLALGISDYLVKPDDKAELVRWVRSLWRFLPGSAGQAEAGQTR